MLLAEGVRVVKLQSKNLRSNRSIFQTGKRLLRVREPVAEAEQGPPRLDLPGRLAAAARQGPRTKDGSANMPSFATMSNRCV